MRAPRYDVAPSIRNCVASNCVCGEWANQPGRVRVIDVQVARTARYTLRARCFRKGLAAASSTPLSVPNRDCKTTILDGAHCPWSVMYANMFQPHCRCAECKTLLVATLRKGTTQKRQRIVFTHTGSSAGSGALLGRATHATQDPPVLEDV